MIMITNLTSKDIGRYVVYTDGAGEKQFGRIKSWNPHWIFVVYHCAGEWDNYRDYTAAATDQKDLTFYGGEQIE